MFISPCIFPILPLYIGILEQDGKKIINTISFIIGLSFIFVLLGFGFGTIGNYLFTPIARKISGIIIIIFGLNELEIFKFNILKKTKIININYKGNNSIIKSLILGITFSLGWTPCIGVILSSILIYASDSASALYGGFLLSIFVLGFLTPFVIFTIFYEKLSNKIDIIKNNMRNIKKFTGLFIIMLGILLILGKLENISIFIYRLFGN